MDSDRHWGRLGCNRDPQIRGLNKMQISHIGLGGRSAPLDSMEDPGSSCDVAFLCPPVLEKHMITFPTSGKGEKGRRGHRFFFSGCNLEIARSLISLAKIWSPTTLSYGGVPVSYIHTHGPSSMKGMRRGIDSGGEGWELQFFP